MYLEIVLSNNNNLQSNSEEAEIEAYKLFFFAI